LWKRKSVYEAVVVVMRGNEEEELDGSG